MPIEIICQSCAQKLRIADQDAGKLARCPSCKATFRVPAQPPAASDLRYERPLPTPDYPPPQPAKHNPFADTLPRPAPPSANPYADLDPQAAALLNAYAPPKAGPYAPPGYGPRTYRKPHRGGLILTFGILGLLFCFFLSIAAWTMAVTDLREMREGVMDDSGKGMTTAGMVLGMISCALAALGIVIQILAALADAG